MKCISMDTTQCNAISYNDGAGVCRLGRVDHAEEGELLFIIEGKKPRTLCMEVGTKSIPKQKDMVDDCSDNESERCRLHRQIRIFTPQQLHFCM